MANMYAQDTDKLIPLMEACGCDICKQLLVVCLPSSLRQLRHSIVKKGTAEDGSCGLHKNANGAAKGGIR